MERLKMTEKTDRGNEILNEGEGKKQLSALQSKYVLVSADKSENNVIVVCRRYYIRKLREEVWGCEDK